ncbi:DUF1015 family protein [Streptococcaceae bacterium ESL0687]|nr:DUF1015 family protein [Streptococcaceae bacterium ESL0687]
MVKVKPFKAIRPNKELADQLASLPYDVVSSLEAKELAEGNPYSFFHIDKAEIDLPEDLSPYDDKVYKQADDNLIAFKDKGWFVQDESNKYYIYQLTMNGRAQTGLVATTSIDDYIEGKIKKHEYTRHEKEIDRINHIKATDANTSPIFLTYRGLSDISTIINDWKKAHAPIYDFTSYYDVNHKVWLLDDPKIIEDLEEAFNQVDSLYIADGHHRTESAVKVGLEKRKTNQSSPESDYFLSILFPDQELEILEYNRILKVDLPVDFMEQVAQSFDIKETESTKPQEAGVINMYLNNKWYQLTIKKELLADDPVEGLDVSYLQTKVFRDIFEIEDIRSDKRIDFVGGIRGSEELVKLVDSGDWDLAFAMYPTQMKDLLEVADAGLIMPPKSTWFEPKLLSGLFLHDLETR